MALKQFLIVQNAIAFSFEAVFPLFGFTDKEFGGLGISVR